MTEQMKSLAELRMQFPGTIAHHRQAAALQWTVFGEGRDDDMAAGLDGVHHGFDVALAILW